MSPIDGTIQQIGFIYGIRKQRHRVVRWIVLIPFENRTNTLSLSDALEVDFDVALVRVVLLRGRIKWLGQNQSIRSSIDFG